MKGAPVSLRLGTIRACVAALIEFIWVIAFITKSLVHSPAPVVGSGLRPKEQAQSSKHLPFKHGGVREGRYPKLLNQF